VQRKLTERGLDNILVLWLLATPFCLELLLKHCRVVPLELEHPCHLVEQSFCEPQWRFLEHLTHFLKTVLVHPLRSHLQP
jgi:hypothetical protein